MERRPKRLPRRWQQALSPRLLTQAWFAAASLITGYRFYLFVFQFRQGMPAAAMAQRPAGVEAFLPIGALVAFRAWVAGFGWDSVHPAALAFFLAFLATALLLKRGFCSWICPFGFLSESLGRLGRWFFGLNLRPPRWLDLTLRAPKYLLLWFFLQAVWLGMSGETAWQFLQSPYYQVSDVKLLRFFQSPSVLTLQVLVLLALLSLLVEGFWCRYLCPYGALLGLISIASPVAVRRRAERCTGCRRCDQVCPARIAVSQASVVCSPECHACLACVQACPVRREGTLELRATAAGFRLEPWTYAAALAALLFLVLAAAGATGHWQTALTIRDYARLIPLAGSIQH